MDMNEIMLWAMGVPIVLIIVHVLIWKHFTSKGKADDKLNTD